MSEVTLQVHVSRGKVLSELFWNQVGSNHASLNNVVSLWLQLTQDIAGKLQSNNASEKEKDAVLQFLTKLDRLKIEPVASDELTTDTVVTRQTRDTEELKSTVSANNAEPKESAVVEISSVIATRSTTKQLDIKSIDSRQTEEVDERQDGDSKVENAQMEERTEDREDVDDDTDDADYDPADEDYRDSEDELDREGTIDDEDATAIFHAIEASLKESHDQNSTSGNVGSEQVRGDKNVDDRKKDSSCVAELHDVTQSQNRNQVRKAVPFEIKNIPYETEYGLTCSICHQSFDDPSLTKQHVKETHDIYKRHACTVCNKRFFKPYTLRCHMNNRHSVKRKVKCSMCCIVMLGDNFDGHVCTKVVKEYWRKDLGSEKQIRKVQLDVDVNKDSKTTGGGMVSQDDNGAMEQVLVSDDVDADVEHPAEPVSDDVDADVEHPAEPEVKEIHQNPDDVAEVTDSKDSDVNERSNKSIETVAGGRGNKGDGLKSQSQSQDDRTDAQEQAKEKIITRKFGLICDICEQTFDDPSVTKRHVEETHDIYMKHACTICDRRFRVPAKLRDHILNVHKTVKKRCKKCSKTMREEKFKSHICIRGSRKKTGLNEHFEKHETLKHVPTMTRSRSRALQLRKNAISIAAKQTWCTLCNKRLSSKKSLNSHTRMMHKKKKPHVCNVCGKEFLWPSNLNRHSAIHAQSKTPEGIPCIKCKRVYQTEDNFDRHVCQELTYKFRCKKCGRKSKTEADLEIHDNEVHKKIKSHFCDICGSGFIRHSDMATHKKQYHSLASKAKSTCHICHKKSKTERLLQAHMRRMHAEHKPFKCDICDKAFASQGMLKAHSQCHLPKKACEKQQPRPTFQCSKCSKMYKNKTSFEKHECQSVAVRFPCKLCGMKCLSEASLKLHEDEIHKKIKSHVCDICGSGFVKRSDMLRHHRVYHEGSEMSTPCDFCGKIFTNRGYLRIHRFNVHLRKQAGGPEIENCYQCEICGMFHRTDGELRAHMKKKHQQDKNQLEKKEKCHLCDKSYRLKANLKSHVESVHMKLRDNLCFQCGKGFYSGHNLQEHINSVHKINKPYTCPECGKGFIYPNRLKRHLQVHKRREERRKYLEANPRPTYPCDQCDRVCTSNSQLEWHKVCHSSERNFKCDQCDKAYKSKSLLQIHHMRSHLKLRPCKCQECDRSFFSKKDLKKHSKIHQPDRPEIVRERWPCDTCDKVFSSKRDSKTHQDWHKGLIQLKCETCGKEFSTKSGLCAHRKTHSNDAWKCGDCGLGFKTSQERQKHQKQEHEGRWDWNRCNVCNKEFNTHNSLQRHMKNHKGGGFKCADCGLTFTTVYAKVKHRKEKHPQGVAFFQKL